MLHLAIPAAAEAEFNVDVVLQTREPGEGRRPTPEELGWPPGFFETVIGSIDDDTFVRPAQGEFPKREAFECDTFSTRMFVSTVFGRRATGSSRCVLAAHSISDLALCTVVTGELRQGALASANPTGNAADVEASVRRFTVIPFDEPASIVYAAVRTDLESRGMAIGPLDTMIAAIAVANGLTLVTHNTAEFSRVPGLNLVDWEMP